ncbi:hypothetical protein [Accumulibacter sp.]|uniref:hypothetical protein n=1 Tax=Accumulibacter sp. TaxID=2053492 RepID=UPI0025880397|nr:hypothetical protein [Accumulibacter sp.]
MLLTIELAAQRAAKMLQKPGNTGSIADGLNIIRARNEAILRPDPDAPVVPGSFGALLRKISEKKEIEPVENALLACVRNGRLRLRESLMGMYVHIDAEEYVADYRSGSLSFDNHCLVVLLSDAIDALRSTGMLLQDELPESQKPKPGATQNPTTYTPAQRLQEQEILRVIAELGYSACELPPQSAGMPGVKAKVRQNLKFSRAVFDKAWNRLRRDKAIREQD